VAALRERFERWSGVGRASSDLAQVARAVAAGSVDTLLLDIDGAIYGRIYDATGAFPIERNRAASSYDIVDEFMGRTILLGGEAIGVRKDDLPDSSSPVAALLRYPV
jgi:hypothetical protein